MNDIQQLIYWEESADEAIGTLLYLPARWGCARAA
jgi:hypothetical protein